MLYRLALLFAVATIVIPGPASARSRRPKLPADLPTLYVTKDVMAIRNGQQKVTVRLTDGSVQLQTPQGNHQLAVNIASRKGWVRPTQAIAPPKTYRAKDVVTAVVTLAVPDDRKMVLRISAYPGVPAVFVKSGVTGQYGSAKDNYYWSWDQAVASYVTHGKAGPMEHRTAQGITAFDQSDWVFLPNGTGGLAVMTNGIVGYQPNQSFIHPLPRWRYLRPGETLDVTFGLAGVASTRDAETLATTARARVAILKPVYLTKQTTINYGAPAPDWLRQTETAIGCEGKWSDDMIGRWMNATLLVVGIPADKHTIAKAREAGLRAIVKVNYAELQNSAMAKRSRKADGATPADLLDLAKHPDWTCIDFDGVERRSAAVVSGDARGVFSTCFHQADLRENALTHVLNIMNLGADGVYIDNACPPAECYGPQFDKHRHDDPYQTNTAAADELLKQIYKLVKTYGEDKVVVHNSGILPAHWAYCDAQVWEGFRHDRGHAEAVYEWAELRYAAEEHAEAIRKGKVGILLPRFVSIPPDKRLRSAFYALAYSKLYGFAVGDWLDLAKSPKLAEVICSVRLGKPLGEVKRSGEVLYRVFNGGIVVLNPTRGAASVDAPTPRDGKLVDLDSGRKITATSGLIKLDMPPESGRVLIWTQ